MRMQDVLAMLEASDKPETLAGRVSSAPSERSTKHTYPQPRRTTHKKCTKCRCWRVHADFGAAEASADGMQSYCKHCKNELGKRRRQKDIKARLKHHIATRISDQLGVFAPKGLSKNLESHLGYTMGALVRGLREELQAREGPERRLKDALDSGYHIDHIRPLKLYNVIKEGEVDWQEMRKCWAISNLSAIPSSENLSKGSKYDG